MSDDDVAEVGMGLGAIANTCRALLNRAAGVTALLCMTSSCAAAIQMDKPESVTDTPVLILIGLLILSALSGWAWYKTQDH